MMLFRPFYTPTEKIYKIYYFPRVYQITTADSRGESAVTVFIQPDINRSSRR